MFLIFSNTSLKNERLNTELLPLYLIIVPILVAFARFGFIDNAVEMSRRIAIKNSETLIQSIENYHKTHGHYPISLQALHYDISPEVIGISQYFYEPNGNSYNVYFKQFFDELDADEIVMYNKLNEHYFTAHSQDILEYTGETLELRRGDRRRVQLSAPNWISIHFE